MINLTKAFGTQILELFYKCDENAANNTVVDSSGQGHGATASVNTSVIADGSGVVGNCFDLSGPARLTLDAELNVGSNITISFWYQHAGWSDSHYFFDSVGSNNGDMRVLVGPNLVVLEFDNGIVFQIYAMADFPDDGDWHHVWITRKGGVSADWADVYVDNVLLSRVGTNGVPPAGESYRIKYIGDAAAFGGEFNGKIDIFQVWNTNEGVLTGIAEKERDFVYNGGNGTEIINTVPRAVHHYKQMAR